MSERGSIFIMTRPRAIQAVGAKHGIAETPQGPSRGLTSWSSVVGMATDRLLVAPDHLRVIEAPPRASHRLTYCPVYAATHALSVAASASMKPAVPHHVTTREP